MAKELKKLMLKEYLSDFRDIKNFIVLSYQGVSSLEAVELREKLGNTGVMFKVVKNSLIVIAFKEIGIPELSEYVNGQCAVATNADDCVGLVKALVDCKKDVANLKINGGLIDGRQVSSEEIVELSKIPDRSVINAQILAGVKAPMVGVANALNAVLRNLLICLKEIKGKKEE